jgi:hypothetical protein
MAISPTGWTAAATPVFSAAARPMAAISEPAQVGPRDALDHSPEPARPDSFRKTRSGVLRERHGEAVRIGLPNGYAIQHEGQGPARAEDAQGRSYPVQVERDQQGQPTEYRFQTPQGSVRLDADDLTLILKNPADTVTQTLECTGRHVVQCQSCFRDGSGRMTDLVQSVSIEPDGLVRNLSRREGVEVSASRLSFRNPLGCKLAFDLPVPVTQCLHGEWVAAPPAPAAVAAPRPGLGPLLME